MPGKRRVLLLRSAIGVFGAEQVILELARGLRSTDFHPVVGVLENKDTSCRELLETARNEELETCFFDCQGPLDAHTIRSLQQYVTECNIVLIHAHGYKANLYALAASHLTSVRCLATCHPWTETGYNLKARLYTYLDKQWLRRMDYLTAVSEDVRGELRSGLSPKPCEVIPNGIQTERFTKVSVTRDYLHDLGVTGQHPVVGAIGRLVPEKGYEQLIDCARLICRSDKNITFLIVGDGPIRHDLEAKVDDLGLAKRVLFAGTRRDIPEILAGLDIFVLSSLSEGLPMVVLEAMASGKAIVATSVGDVPKLIAHGETGLLVPPADAQALATAVANISQDKELRQQLGERARQFVQEHYSAQRMLERYVKCYEKVLNGKNQP